MDKPRRIIKIDEDEYVLASSVPVPAEKVDGMDHVIVRTRSAGVHAGYLKSRTGQEVVLIQSRRLWQWAGAMELSQLATEGVKKPKECKFAVPVTVTLLDAIEIIPTTSVARASIAGVALWQK